MTSKEAIVKVNLKHQLSAGPENYQYLTSVWQQKVTCTFRDFLRLYNNKDVFPTLEAMQKMVDFHHKNGIDMSKLGCTLPNPANICIHKSTSAKFYPIKKNDNHLLENTR